MSARASLAYFLSRGVSGVLAVATVSLFARRLGPEGYGVLALTITTSAFIAGVIVQPLHQCLARLMPRPGFEGIVPTLGRGLVLACLATLPLALLLELLPQHWLPAGVPLLAVLLGACQGAFDFGAQYCSSTLQARRYGRLYFMKALLVPALGLSVLYLGGNAAGVVLAMAASFFLATVIAARQPWLEVIRGKFEARFLPEIRTYAVPMGLSLLVGVMLQWSDRLILAAHVPRASLGGYSAAGDFAIQGFGLVFNAFHLAWFPRIVSAWERSRADAQSLLDRYLRLSACVLLPASVGLVLVSQDVVGVLLGDRYGADAARVMPWLVVAASLSGLRAYFTDLSLHLTQAMRRQSAIVGGCAAFSVCANLLLVPRYGAVSAAWVAVASNVLGLILSFHAGRGVLVFRLRHLDALAVLVACAFLIFAVLAIPGGSVFGLALRVAAGVAVYSVTFFSLNGGGVRDLVMARWRQNHV